LYETAPCSAPPMLPSVADIMTSIQCCRAALPRCVPKGCWSLPTQHTGELLKVFECNGLCFSHGTLMPVTHNHMSYVRSNHTRCQQLVPLGRRVRENCCGQRMHAAQPPRVLLGLLQQLATPPRLASWLLRVARRVHHAYSRHDIGRLTPPLRGPGSGRLACCGGRPVTVRMACSSASVCC
jgi:hypothetical protein